jgi:hypothetical protein
MRKMGVNRSGFLHITRCIFAYSSVVGRENYSSSDRTLRLIDS